MKLLSLKSLISLFLITSASCVYANHINDALAAIQKEVGKVTDYIHNQVKRNGEMWGDEGPSDRHAGHRDAYKPSGGHEGHCSKPPCNEDKPNSHKPDSHKPDCRGNGSCGGGKKEDKIWIKGCCGDFDYILFYGKAKASRKDARNKCQCLGGDLAEITAENGMCLSSVVKAKDPAYIGSWNTDTYAGARIALYPNAVIAVPPGPDRHAFICQVSKGKCYINSYRQQQGSRGHHGCDWAFDEHEDKTNTKFPLMELSQANVNKLEKVRAKRMAKAALASKQNKVTQ